MGGILITGPTIECANLTAMPRSIVSSNDSTPLLVNQEGNFFLASHMIPERPLHHTRWRPHQENILPFQQIKTRCVQPALPWA